MHYKTFSLLVGFMIWLTATLLFRVAGQYFFLTSNTAVLLGLYLIAIPVLGFTANGVFNKYQLRQAQSVQSAAMMVLPGMIADCFCVAFFTSVFPNLPSTDAAAFGSWLLWCYAWVLLFGLVRKAK